MKILRDAAKERRKNGEKFSTMAPDEVLKQQLKHLTSVGLLADGTAGEFAVSFGEIAATSAPAPAPGPSPPGPPGPAAGIDLFQFGRPGVQPWKVTNDPVMGGQSKSSFVVGKDGAGAANVGLFAGDVAIARSIAR